MSDQTAALKKITGSGLGLLAVPLLAVLLVQPFLPEHSSQDLRELACRASQEAVLQDARGSASARFPAMDAAGVSVTAEDDHYTVAAYYEAPG